MKYGAASKPAPQWLHGVNYFYVVHRQPEPVVVTQKEEPVAFDPDDYDSEAFYECPDVN